LNRKIENGTWNRQVGRIKEVKETFIRSKGPISKIGEICFVGEKRIPYEVISLESEEVTLMPLAESGHIRIGDAVMTVEKSLALPNPLYLLGRTLNAFGDPIDRLGRFRQTQKTSLEAKTPHSLDRKRIKEPIETGIKAVDTLLSIGRGQKIGVFAGTGVGKSTLMGMMARKSKEDINVIALIGERGREVREFMEKELGEEGLKRSVLVVSTSDETPLMHMKAALLATSIAEMFRDKGKNVLLMMDSVTRFAMARRVYDIATGDIPMAGGKTLGMEPSMQRLLERSGNSTVGSITGIYTVLVENDDLNGVIPDTARGILDGHIVLTRKLADQGHFPAIDVLGSVSRVMQDIVSEEHLKVARTIKKYIGLFKENEEHFKMDLLEVGKEPDVDRAIYYYPFIQKFLRQEMDESFSFEESYELLRGIIT
jgi:flagellum-specific ATP synthase